ncbi:MAG: DUF4926 domain-containing protein [Patescibacteria group bacterium]
MYNEFDIVELTHDILEDNLKEGESGTIVDIYRNGKAYEVEFVNPDGTTKALLTLMPEDIRAYTSKDEYASRLFNAPISLGTVSSMTFDTVVNNDELRITTKTFESKIDKKEFRYPTIPL